MTLSKSNEVLFSTIMKSSMIQTLVQSIPDKSDNFAPEGAQEICMDVDSQMSSRGHLDLALIFFFKLDHNKVEIKNNRHTK